MIRWWKNPQYACHLNHVAYQVTWHPIILHTRLKPYEILVNYDLVIVVVVSKCSYFLQNPLGCDVLVTICRICIPPFVLFEPITTILLCNFWMVITSIYWHYCEIQPKKQLEITRSTVILVSSSSNTKGGRRIRRMWLLLFELMVYLRVSLIPNLGSWRPTPSYST